VSGSMAAVAASMAILSGERAVMRRPIASDAVNAK
jgi:hypothetical protein